ncbi:MAG: site-specific DNA-methyltransferase [Lentisphaerae bacterium]|nr:site-specific DNA-methyltransferase [Lentisphaerota bacterium]
MSKVPLEPVARETPVLATDRLKALLELFPEVACEGRVDVDKLRALLGEAVDDRPERYAFSWAGKRDAMRVLAEPSRATLIPDRDQSQDFDSSGNVFIEGDNLEVLKLLYKSYFGRVRMIYIDPPYNTGNDFVYPDNFRDPLDTYLKITGQRDSEGNLLTSNTDASGRYHSAWLSMMYPRLVLARQLLREDGVICVSMDDSESHNLRLLLDEVFGGENHIATIVWQKRYVSNVTAKWLSDMHDFIFVYARDAGAVSVVPWEKNEAQLEAYRNPDNDARGPWRAQDLSASKQYNAGQFTITGPTGLKFQPPPGRYWRCNEAQFTSWLSDGRIWWGLDRNSRPMLKAFLSEVGSEVTPHTWWSHDFAGHNKEATLELKALFDGMSPFDTPKPVRLLEHLTSLDNSRASCLKPLLTARKPCKATACTLKRDV